MRITFFPFLSLLLACNAHQPETPVDAGAENVRAVVQSVQPQRRDLTDWLDLNAVTQYRRKENIRATATGYLRQFRLQPGDHLQAGATIGVLVTKEQAALHDLRDLPELQGTREPLPIKTEASGIVTALNFQEGDFVSEGEVIVTVSQPHSLALLLNVPYEYQRFVSPGQSCIITLPDGWELRGRVSKAMPSVDLASQTQLFLVELVGRHDLPENLNVGLRIARGKHAHVLCVPLTAVQTDEMQQEFWVMKILGDSLAVKVPVIVGLRADSMQEVRSPLLLVTDRVVGEGAFGLADTARIEIKNEQER